MEEDGWIHLRKDSSALLPPGWFPEDASGEAACLVFLLRRHPGEADPLAETLLLMKAREAGPASWEKACRALHRDFAARLRTHSPLPRLFGEACDETERSDSSC